MKRSCEKMAGDFWHGFPSRIGCVVDYYHQNTSGCVISDSEMEKPKNTVKYADFS